ncbi:MULTISPECIES: MFS transporter [unclassified Paenibacillus]|uniref:MFS transporter n=1 Tax=unclassified Paenibacillus TaxID=185978 RepID=UPI002785E300|nr:MULTISPECIES: MFS transporter [unclassified Paenibacillus]MDQ0896886.1 YQGE family putative transporter [Paenibacillus sp. V4I7]MDQ0916966.1 YQGE family putative transporter [Paenibacillus sp. V4I5]
MGINRDIKQLLLMNTSSMIIFNFIGIFVNLYIWQKNQSIFDVTWFNLVMFTTWGFAFIFGTQLIKKWTTQLLIRVVALCGAVTFTMLSFLELENRMFWIACIAVPVGIMWSFYAVAQNISLTKLGKGKDFESYFSFSSIIGQIVSIVNPLLFAGVISFIGFNGSFLLMFVFVALLMVVSFYIPAISLKDEKQEEEIKNILRIRPIQWIMLSCMIAGFFLQFQGLFALVFTFSISENKLVIALLSIVYTLSTIVAMILYRKKKVRDSTWLSLGMVMISFGFLLALFQYPWMLIASNVLTTMGMFYFGTIWNTKQFKIIAKHSIIEQSKILIWRELSLTISRIIMLALILSVEKIQGPVFISLMIVAILCAVITPLVSNKMGDAADSSKHGKSRSE